MRRPIGLGRAPRALEAIAILTLARLGLKLSPRRVAASFLRRAGRAGPSVGGADARAYEVTRTVESVARRTGGACLSQALTGWLMLSRRGISSTVRIGARRVEAGVQMHAWLEVGGVRLIGGADAAGFVPFER